MARSALCWKVCSLTRRRWTSRLGACCGSIRAARASVAAEMSASARCDGKGDGGGRGRDWPGAVPGGAHSVRRRCTQCAKAARAMLCKWRARCVRRALCLVTVAVFALRFLRLYCAVGGIASMATRLLMQWCCCAFLRSQRCLLASVLCCLLFARCHSAAPTGFRYFTRVALRLSLH